MAATRPELSTEPKSSAVQNTNPHISFITIGVRDLAAMTRFYTEVMGWTLQKEQEGVSFFKMASGTIFALFGEQDLADDIGLKNYQADKEPGFKCMSLAINFDSIIKVDAFFAELKEKGVAIQKEPHTVFWGGYSGYFKDPENNYWEVAYNPFL